MGLEEQERSTCLEWEKSQMEDPKAATSDGETEITTELEEFSALFLRIRLEKLD